MAGAKAAGPLEDAGADAIKATGPGLGDCTVGAGSLEAVGAGPVVAAGAGPLEATGAGPFAAVGAGPLAAVGAGPLAVAGTCAEGFETGFVPDVGPMAAWPVLTAASTSCARCLLKNGFTVEPRTGENAKRSMHKMADWKARILWRLSEGWPGGGQCGCVQLFPPCAPFSCKRAEERAS